MNDPRYEKLRETGWRRKLTAAEEAELRSWLAAHPEAQADWEAERNLNQALNGLPDVPVATNFTARVVQAARREARGATAKRSWHTWLPRVALASIAFAMGLIGYREYTAAKKLALVHTGVAAVAEVASAPSPDILRDFEAIRQLNSTPQPDGELLDLFQPAL